MPNETGVLLINPPYEHTVGRFQRLAHFTDPPLGIAYLASFLREQLPEVKTDILDAAALNMTLAQIVGHIEQKRPRIVGLSSVTITANLVKKIARAVRKILPETLLVAGGIHPTVLPNDFFPDMDVSVLGEGELTMLELARAFLGGKRSSRDFSDIRGIVFSPDGEPVRTAERPLIPDLSTLPFPARDLLPLDKYLCQYPHRAPTRRYSTMIISRGCPYDCTFCCSKQIWRREVRFRSPDDILDELHEVRERHQISMIHFADDNFCLSRERSLELFRRMIEEKTDVRWSCLTRVDALDEDLLRLMKQAGCVELHIGVESGDPEVLKSINKNISVPHIKEVFALVKKAGINSKGSFILGNRGETRETILKTIDLALELDPTTAFISIMVPYPGTPIFEEYKEKNLITTYDWDRYNYYMEPVFQPEGLPASELKKMRIQADSRFYFRPRKILKYAFDAVRSGRPDILMHSFWNIMNKVFG
ncbi:MAG: radical SAM protein [bacterium]